MWLRGHQVRFLRSQYWVGIGGIATSLACCYRLWCILSTSTIEKEHPATEHPETSLISDETSIRINESWMENEGETRW